MSRMRRVIHFGSEECFDLVFEALRETRVGAAGLSDSDGTRLPLRLRDGAGAER